MDPSAALTAPLWLAGGLLLAAGVAKIAVPDEAMAALHRLRLPSGRRAARLLGLGEMGLGLAVVLVGGRVPALLLATAYVPLSAVAARQRARQQSCGCFGAARLPVTRAHLAVNGVAAACGLLAALWSPWSLRQVAADAGALAAVTAVLLLVAGVGATRALLVAHATAALRADAAAGGSAVGAA